MGNYPEKDYPWDDDTDIGWLPRTYQVDPDDKPLFAKEPKMTLPKDGSLSKGWTDRGISGYGSVHEDSITEQDTTPVFSMGVCNGCGRELFETKEQIVEEHTIGYHTNNIAKGVFGDASKIKEEVDEFLDALSQDATLMALHELSDLYGAIEGYLEKHHPAFSMLDLKKMSDITKRAFKVGHRT